MMTTMVWGCWMRMSSRRERPPPPGSFRSRRRMSMELCARARRAVATESADWVEKPRLAAISEQALRMGASSSTTRTRRGGRRSVSMVWEDAGAELRTDGCESWPGAWG
jgi:hypothetical protein